MYLEVSLKYDNAFSDFLHKATATWGYMKLDQNNKPEKDTSKSGGTYTATSDKPAPVTGVAKIKLHGKGRPELKGAPISIKPRTARRLARALVAFPNLKVFDAIDAYYTDTNIADSGSPYSNFVTKDKAAINAAILANPNIDLDPI